MKQLIRQSLLLIFVLTGILSAGHLVSATKDMTPATKAYQRQLQSEVDTINGAPRGGRNPANQAQVSLAAAASLPAGNGQRVDKPAAAVTGKHRHTIPSAVLPDTKKTGVLSSGCLVNYGTPGAQCVTAGKSESGGSR